MILVEVYDALRAAGCIGSQREFSTLWLGRQPSYLSSMAARTGSRTVSTEVLLTLIARLQRYAVDAGPHRRVIEPLAARVMAEISTRISAKVESPS